MIHQSIAFEQGKRLSGPPQARPVTPTSAVPEIVIPGAGLSSADGT
jgi:hypothetical protein